ncbi:hypothetical protein ABZ896_11605 [Streptomyces sp. NPDC047072]|uniref:hypothetical protein n=1 Tax=Streptomyces sp. NPDC047072 TaxID=3154809 RepID=UPI0033FFA36C
MSPTALPVPAPVPEFLAPRIEAVRLAIRSGQPQQALDMARAISGELADSHGPLHVYTLHALELAAFCAQMAGRPADATETSLQAAAGFHRLLGAGHRHVERQIRNAAAHWLTVSDLADAVRTGTAFLALLQSLDRPHPAAVFVERRLAAITGPDPRAAELALRAHGPALLIRP